MTNKILFTAAGFTHNFGAPLASGIETLIFNHPSIQKEYWAKKLLQNNFDYEDIYYKVVQQEGSKYNEEQKKIISEVIFDAYLRIDNLINTTSIRNQILYDTFRYLLNKFQWIFTLNQDGFIERHSRIFPNITYNLPGAGSKLFNKDPSNYNFNINKDFFEITNCENISILQPKNQQINLIKLHGSFDWISKTDLLMIIGRDKVQAINRHPLLRAYLEEFNKQIMKEHTKLMVNGYGFRDMHINEMLEKAVNDAGLSIYIICPKERKQFFSETLANLSDIKKGIVGYYPYELSDLFPADCSDAESIQWQEIKRDFFEE